MAGDRVLSLATNAIRFWPAPLMLPAPVSMSRSIPSHPYLAGHCATSVAMASAADSDASHGHPWPVLYASPPMANMILVPFGTAPFSPEPLVFASVAMAGGTAGILYGLRNVRKIVLDPI